jgi:hypothetical protein
MATSVRGSAVEAVRQCLAKIKDAEAAYDAHAREMDAFWTIPGSRAPEGGYDRQSDLSKQIEYARAELQGCVQGMLDTGRLVDA